jgi:hypothetical protein
MGTHLHLTFTLFLYQNEHITRLLHAISKHSPSFPVYIVQLQNGFLITFDEEWDISAIEREFANEFPEYEYVDEISRNGEDVLLRITRTQHPSSSNSWGQTWNEDSLISERYFIKKRKREPIDPPHSTFWVLFGEELKEYKVHISPGKIENTDRTGFLVIEPTMIEGDKPNILSELLPTRTEAFWKGYHLKQEDIETDFEEFQKQQAKERRRKKKN